MRSNFTMTILGIVASVLPPWATAAEPDAHTVAVTPIVGVDHALDAVTAYEPVYLLMQPNPLMAKFQMSLAVRMVGAPEAKLAHGERRNGLYMSFSQTSLWDLEGDSKPFFDSSYRPEAWYHQALPKGPLTFLGAEGGFGHESNGRDGDLSRSFNHLFLRLVGREELGDGWHVSFHPRGRIYVTSLDENPDIARYRGNVDVEFDIGREDGLQFATIGRIGNALDRGSIQEDISYPFGSLTNGWAGGYLHAQIYHGYNESLRAYDEKVSHVLVGISFVR